MLRNQTSRKLLATLFTCVYIFVAMFAQHFHNHGSGEVFKDFHFQKPEKTYTKSHHPQEFTDCLSCHFSHDGKILIPQNFTLEFTNIIDFKKQIYAYQQRFGKLEIYYFQLRGPPSNFI